MFKPKMIENVTDFCCSKGHNLPVVTIALDPKLSRNQRLLCSECLEDTDIDAKLIGIRKFISLIEENQVKKMEKVENIIMNSIKLIESLQSTFDQMKQHILQQLNQLITLMMEWIQTLQQQGSQYSQYSFYEELEIMFLEKNKTDASLQLLIHEIQNTNLFWASKLNPNLEQYNQFVEYHKCKELLLSLELSAQKLTHIEKYQQINILQKNYEKIQYRNTKLNIQPAQTIQSTHPTNFKPFNYQIIKESLISQSDYCDAIAIDNDCSTLVAGCQSQIKVFEFNQGIIKQIQTLNEHYQIITTLNFIRKQKQFISGSCDNSIIIWKYNQNNLWGVQQILNGHADAITCLVININEDLMISGSDDKTIKFWMKKNEWLCQQKITDHSGSVFGLSLNQQQNRVVSCGYDKVILILEKSGQNTEWNTIQKITVEQYGYRVCFIDNNMFTFSPDNKEQICIFEINTINKLFTKTKDITIKCGSDGNCLFPQQYIQQKCILLSKNGEYVNLIRKKQNGEFLTEQSIYFGTTYLFGGMSDDGEYLITWDIESKTIQIRKYKEQ